MSSISHKHPIFPEFNVPVFRLAAATSNPNPRNRCLPVKWGKTNYS